MTSSSVVVTLWMFPGLSVRKFGPAACMACVLCNQSLIPRVSTVWLKWPISFYSGKDLCIESKVQLLLYSTMAALPTLPIDGSHKGLTLHHPLKPCHSCNSGQWRRKIVEFRWAEARRHAALPCFSPANIELFIICNEFIRRFSVTVLGALGFTSIRLRQIINFHTSFNPTLVC